MFSKVELKIGRAIRIGEDRRCGRGSLRIVSAASRCASRGIRVTFRAPTKVTTTRADTANASTAPTPGLLDERARSRAAPLASNMKSGTSR